MSQHTTHILYLHGFRSSPRSAKAQRLAAEVLKRQQAGHDLTWACPQLPPSPAQTVRELLTLTTGWPQGSMVVVGSSLGGFYATVLAQRLGCRALVINPAVAPARDLARYIGELTSFHDPEDHFFFRPEFVDEFKALDPYPITQPERYWALIAQGDEVLNWQEMQAHYPGVTGKVLPGSDHAVSDFDEHLPDVMQALDLPIFC